MPCWTVIWTNLCWHYCAGDKISVLIFSRFCGIIADRTGRFSRFFLYPQRRDFFICKGRNIMNTPNFLRNLLQSNDYLNKNSNEYKKANEYLQSLFPGQMQLDASGRYTAPEYDMTYEQFIAAQQKFDDDIAMEIQEAESDNDDIDFSQFVETQEVIDVRVLMPSGSIQNKELFVYTLNVPDDPDIESNKSNSVWIWHADKDDRICDECASMDGMMFENEDDIPEFPHHPNCRCWIEELKLDNNIKPASKKLYKKPKLEKGYSKESLSKTPTFEKPIDVKNGQYAKFDGKTLTIYQDNKPIMSWDAVSGKKGFQSPKYQNLKSTGPIPEGTYVARQSELQFYKDISWGDRQRSSIGFGTWRGGTNSWGNSRVWLEPSRETNTLGRDGFSIHGGTEPGSAGCIDLTFSMDNFAKWFENNGQDLLINVEY